MHIFSFSPFGYEGTVVSVEVDLRRGIPAVDIVGLADGAVKESRERMRSAIRNSGFDFPSERVLISLAPADLKKEGAGFDLALALAVLDRQRNGEGGDGKILVIGELELSGIVRPVRGIHAAASTALSLGISACIVSAENEAEAREVRGMRVFGAETLCEAFSAYCDPDIFITESGECEKQSAPENSEEIEGVFFPDEKSSLTFSDVIGQRELIRACQIAAAGGHNLLAVGPPGCGKTMVLQKFPALLPSLTHDEAQSVTRIHSLAGLLSPSNPLKTTAPFRMPHQTASIEGMCGGGSNCRPGEISLAHNGVLFLDEASEFKTSVLQMLRVPLEIRSVTLSRAGRTSIYPAGFQLLMAANPCPCGNLGIEGKVCLCSVRSIENYWKKFSGPLLDRIDIRVLVCEESRGKKEKPLSLRELRVPIAKAIRAQRERQGKKNVFLTHQEITEYCALSEEEQDFLESESAKRGFSQRASDGCLKLARTIADTQSAAKVNLSHLKEAFSLRQDCSPV